MPVKYIRKPASDAQIMRQLHPAVRKWVKNSFGKFTPPQRFALPVIEKRKSILITAPTGSGKTLSAFLSIIDCLFKLSEKGKLEERVYCIYCSPLRALANDIHRNLEIPLEEITKIMGGERKIRIAKRTGDTTPKEKQQMLKHPPHILITTPESLAIMISAPKFSENLRGTEFVILDEIHELADSKRGVHLSLTLERLQGLQDESRHAGKAITRIGLGATLEPLDEVAEFLVGCKKGKSRDCLIADARFIKNLDMRLLCPVRDIVRSDTDKINRNLYEMLASTIKENRTTLIFVNTRSATERVCFRLKHMLPGFDIEAHHSSLSREDRLGVEERLKKGELRAVITSSSLELGIDIGSIDMVLQIGSPKSVSRCLQRIGRSGHSMNATIKGRIICMDRDDIIECGVMIKEAYARNIDRLVIPSNCLDVLAQHVLGMAVLRKWGEKEAFNLVKSSYCYKDLKEKDFLSVLKFMAGGYALENYKVYGKIWWDPETKEFGKRGKLARVIYALNIGTIPDEVAVKVYTMEGRPVGHIDAEFLERLTRGDRFLLGGRVYEYVSSHGVRANVNIAKDAKPTVPSWFSEMLPLSNDLAKTISQEREKISRMGEKAINYIRKEFRADYNAANSILEYVKQESGILRLEKAPFPSGKNLLVELYVDDDDRTNVIFHTLLGRRVNEALSRAYGFMMSEFLGRNVGLAVTDNGFAVILPSGIRIKNMEDFVDALDSKTVEETIKKAVSRTEMLRRRFRHCGTRSLMILRNYLGFRIRVGKQQLSASSILRACDDIPDFPVLKETHREILEDHMDILAVKEFLKNLEKGKIRKSIVTTEVPSPFSHNIVLLGLSDIILMEDRKKALERLHSRVMASIGAQ